MYYVSEYFDVGEQVGVLSSIQFRSDKLGDIWMECVSLVST